MTSSLASRILKAVCHALPRPGQAFAGSLFWAIMMALSALVTLWMNERIAPEGLVQIAMLYAIGGFLAFVPALTVTKLLPARRKDTAFAAAFTAFTFSTIFFTGLTLAISFRFRQLEFAGEPFTSPWFFELLLTVAASMYHIAVLGLRLYLPVGLIALVGISLWHAKRSR